MDRITLFKDFNNNKFDLHYYKSENCPLLRTNTSKPYAQHTFQQPCCNQERLFSVGSEYFWVGFHKANWILLAESNGDESWRQLAVTWSWLADVLHAFPTQSRILLKWKHSQNTHSFTFPVWNLKLDNSWLPTLINPHPRLTWFFTCNQDTV